MARRAKSFSPPFDELDATVVLWGKGQEFYYDAIYKGNGFNPGRKGNARFSPIRAPGGKIIPTLYAGTTLDRALMETIFHDVPFTAGFKPLSIKKMAGKVHTVFTPRVDLKLIDLSTIALRRARRGSRAPDRHHEVALPGNAKVGGTSLRPIRRRTGVALDFSAGR